MPPPANSFQPLETIHNKHNNNLKGKNSESFERKKMQPKYLRLADGTKIPTNEDGTVNQVHMARYLGMRRKAMLKAQLDKLNPRKK